MLEKAVIEKAVIVDMDGTLAQLPNHTGVRHWREWHKVLLDPPNQPVVELVKVLARAGYRILVVSGRDEVCQADTETWLKQHGVPWDLLLLRRSGDHRPDGVVKAEMYARHIAGRYDVRFSLDDRNSSVAGWRSLGIPCFQVAPGDF